VTDRIFAVLCFTKIAKRRITQTTIFDNARTYFADIKDLGRRNYTMESRVARSLCDS